MKLSVPALMIALASFVQADPWILPSLAEHAHPASGRAPAADPRTYPDPDGFAARSQRILEDVASGGLDKWRKGYFAGGDPGKYLPGHAMAKFLLDPENPEARQYMNDARSFKEHYHFAAVNWARFYPIFGERVLTAETRQKLADAAFAYSAYRNPSGTENHKVMWWTSANVLPHFLEGGRGLARHSKEATLLHAKGQLRDYVKGLFAAGQGEWDSSTYLMFDVNGLLNIYDFTPDPETRLLAAAALDYLVAAYALKYTDGVYCAPNQRGYTSRAMESISDQTGYLWWGSSRELAPGEARDFRYTLAPITSAWRPNAVLHNIATRQIPLPAEQRNSKANYWHGGGITPRPGSAHETVYLHAAFTMGSLWDQHQSQHSRFMVAVRSPQGPLVFSGGHPRKSDHTGKKTGIGFTDGTGRYVQSAQSGRTYLCMALSPEDEEHAYTYFTYPNSVIPEQDGDWIVFPAGEVRLAVLPLNGEFETDHLPGKGGTPGAAFLKMPGKRSGFVLRVLLPGERAQGTRVDLSRFEEDMAIVCVSPGEDPIEMRFVPAAEGDLHGSHPAEVRIGGARVDFGTWDIYGGPFITQRPGVLEVSDGTKGFRIDVTGTLPVYSPLTP